MQFVIQNIVSGEYVSKYSAKQRVMSPDVNEADRFYSKMFAKIVRNRFFGKFSIYRVIEVEDIKYPDQIHDLEVAEDKNNTE